MRPPILRFARGRPWLGCVLFLGACGQGSPTPIEPSARPLTPPLFDLELDTTTFTALAGVLEVTGEGELELAGDGPIRISLPGPFDLRFATHLFFEMRAAPGLELSLSVAQVEGADVQEWPGLKARLPNEEWAPVGVELPAHAGGLVDGLELRFDGEACSRGLQLRAARIVSGPPAGWAEALAANGPELLALGDEARFGRVLTRSATLEIGLQANAGDLLSFSVGFWSPGGRVRDARVVVTGADRGLELARLEAAETEGWQRLELALPDPPPASLSFTLEGNAELLAGIAEVARFDPRESPRTVLLVTSDTHRGDHVGALGDLVQTPALDALGERGLTFTDCFSTTNVTVPSHVAILTGVHPRDSGVTDNRSALSEEAVTLAEHFRAAGYATFASTSIHLLDHAYSRLGQGFDRFSAPPQRRSAADSIAVLQGWLPDVRDRPLFVWLHLFDAHGPYAPPERMTGLYWPADRDPGDPAIQVEDGRVPEWAEGVRDLEYVRALYRGSVSYLDFALAQLLSTRRFKKGIVAFTADHGECLGDHDVWWAHKGIHPDTLHVPLILRGPGARSGELVDTPVSQMDLGRTLLDMAGLQDVSFPGVHLVDTLEQAAGRPRFALDGARSASVTRNGWHLIRHLVRHKRGRGGEVVEAGREELFDLTADPGADRDLAAAEPERRRELGALLDDWLAERADATLLQGRHEDAETLRRLAELGYVEDGQ